MATVAGGDVGWAPINYASLHTTPGQGGVYTPFAEDATDPAFANVSPASGTVLTGTSTPITFEIDNPSDLPFVIWLQFTNDARAWVVYDSLSGFFHPFTESTVTEELAFSLVQLGGWQADITQLRLGGVA